MEKIEVKYQLDVTVKLEHCSFLWSLDKIRKTEKMCHNDELSFSTLDRVAKPACI